MKLYAWIPILALVGCVCGGTNSGSTEDPDTSSAVSASGIAYNLVRTKVKVGVVLTLESCDDAKGPIARASYSISPIAAPDTHYAHGNFNGYKYLIDGADLKSLSEKRSLSVELHDHGGIKSLGSSSADRTFGIVGGLIKLVPLFSAPDTADPMDKAPACNGAISGYLTLRNQLRIKLHELARSMPNSNDKEKVSNNMEAVVTAIARLETGPLRISLSRTIDIRELPVGDKIDRGVIMWKVEEFSKWVDLADGVAEKTFDQFSLNYCISSDFGNTSTCPSSVADNPPNQAPATKARCGTCGSSVVLREPIAAQILLSTRQDSAYFTYNNISDFDDIPGQLNGHEREPDELVSRAGLLVSQWGEPTHLDIDVGLAEEISVSASFDEFGRKSKFGWTSNARGQALVDGANSVVDIYNSTIDGADLAEKKARLSELETLQKLNKLENCRSILENGGFECPDE